MCLSELRVRGIGDGNQQKHVEICQHKLDKLSKLSENSLTTTCAYGTIEEWGILWSDLELQHKISGGNCDEKG